MIAQSRRSTRSLPLTRHFEFTRLEDQLLSHAYQALIPVVSRRVERPRSRDSNNEPATTKIQNLRSKVRGA